MTSNLQFAGMEAPTCVFITKNIVEETGARSGLLRATSRLVVVSYTKDVDMEEVRKRFVVHDTTTIREEMRKEEMRKEERRKHEEKMRKMEAVAAEVDDAAKKGDIAGIKQLQERDTSGKLSCHQHYIINHHIHHQISPTITILPFQAHHCFWS